MQPIYDWFRKTLWFIPPHRHNPNFTAKMCENDAKKDVLNFLQAADLQIADVNIEKELFDAKNLPNNMPTYLKEEYTKNWQGKEIINIKTLHKNKTGKLVILNLKTNPTAHKNSSVLLDVGSIA